MDSRWRILIPAVAFLCLIALIYQPWQLSLWSTPWDSQSSTRLTTEPSEMYWLGVGKADITGPVVEVNMMGYADSNQVGSGLRQRLYTRAFIVARPDDLASRIAYLVLDIQSGDTAIRYGIIEALRALGAEYEIYTQPGIIAVTGTHSHSGPGAWLNYLLPQITSRGFSKESYEAIVSGSVRAIKRAHDNLTPGRLALGTGNSSGISINRSPYAYLQNPAVERALYSSDIDTEMTVLKFEDSTGKQLGVLTWLPVHGTSLYQNNTLISGDNKGVAAYLLEQDMKTENPDYVAGFSQANVGDTSPNVLGAFCEDTGLACRFNDSTCTGRTQGCHGRGPYFQIVDQGTTSCYEIGARQYRAAKAILDSPDLNEIKFDTVSSFHVFHNMTDYHFTSDLHPGKNLQTCSAALGYGFAGGTTDGPGAFDFRQGTNDTDENAPALKNPLWKIARSFVHPPSEDQQACQSPKPILLDVGAATKPYAWTPNIVDIQMQRIGPLLIIVAPGEATTMSGRRWRKAIAEHAVSSLGLEDAQIVIGGPANTYGHYIATEEEYAVQRYEGASTLFGPHTLAAYINLTATFLVHLNDLPRLKDGPNPPINIDNSYNFINPVVIDRAGIFRSFGQSISSPDPNTVLKPGDVATATFVGANPRNNYRLEETFAAVERFEPDTEKWVQVRNDADWYLTFHWRRTSTILGTSEVDLRWQVDDQGDLGSSALYRFRYHGDAKGLGGAITSFEGVSNVFRVETDRSDADGELVR